MHYCSTILVFDQKIIDNIFMINLLGRGNDYYFYYYFCFLSADDVLIYKSTDTHRVLPPSLINGKSLDNPQPFGSNDAGNRSALGDQRLVGHDERAIYQEALQVFLLVLIYLFLLCGSKHTKILEI